MAYTGSKGFGCTANVYALFHLIYPSQMEQIIIPDGPEKWKIRWQGTGKIRGTGCFPSHYPGCVKFRERAVPHIAYPARLGEINTENTAGIVSARCGIRAGASVAASFRILLWLAWAPPVPPEKDRPPRGETAMEELPLRSGAKPKTSPGAPHQQLDQNSPEAVYARLKERAFDFPHVDRRPSIISVPGAEALWLHDDQVCGCKEAFMRGNEFAHVHPPYDGSMHAMLPLEEVRDLLKKGWGEMHPLVRTGALPQTSVMVFGPRDEEELEIILHIL